MNVARLTYAAIASLDGYVADTQGGFGWAAPDEEVHAFVNELQRPIGTYLYGRRLYDVMAPWETMGVDPDEPEVVRDFAQVWRAAEKVVYSSTLTAPTTPRTRLERSFDPAAVRRLVDESPAEVSVGGAQLAGQALHAGLVDECHLFVVPAIIGGGTHWLPSDLRVDLELLAEHRFGNGTVHLHYRLATGQTAGPPASR
jgi:dihydrofolate reductase